MTALDLAKEYLEIFYNSHDVGELKNILDENLHFEGPFLICNSANEYINALKRNPPKGMSYKIINELHNASSASVIYQFYKGDIQTKFAQHFQINENKISKIITIFDSAQFA